VNIPKAIKSGGHWIKVEKVPTRNIDNSGTFDTYHRLIRIREDVGIPESVIAETFLHEILEVIKICNNLEIDHTHLTILSEHLFQIMRDNRLNFSDPDSIIKQMTERR